MNKPYLMTIAGGRVVMNVDMLPEALRKNRPNRSDCDEAAEVIEQLLQRLRESSQTTPAGAGDGLSNAARDVLAERRRQVEVEGWSPEHDDEHDAGQMAVAAAGYAMANGELGQSAPTPRWWPWSAKWWKPRDDRRNLVKAGALILAEIERLDRQEARS